MGRGYHQFHEPGSYVEAAQRAVKAAFGKDPVFVREGGTIGAVLSMEQLLKAPVVLRGLSLPDHGYHAPNENYDCAQGASTPSCQRMNA